MNGAVVCNSNPIIALEQIGRLDLLERLFHCIVVAPAVTAETAPILTPHAWVHVQAPSQLLSAQVLSVSLGRGRPKGV